MKSFIIFLLLLTVVLVQKKKMIRKPQLVAIVALVIGVDLHFHPLVFQVRTITQTAFFSSGRKNFGNTSIMWNGNWRDSLASSGTLPSAPVSITQNTSYCYLGYSVLDGDQVRLFILIIQPVL